MGINIELITYSKEEIENYIKKLKQKLYSKYKNSLLALEDEFSQITKKMK